MQPDHLFHNLYVQIFLFVSTSPLNAASLFWYVLPLFILAYSTICIFNSSPFWSFLVFLSTLLVLFLLLSSFIPQSVSSVLLSVRLPRSICHQFYFEFFRSVSFSPFLLAYSTIYIFNSSFCLFSSYSLLISTRLGWKFSQIPSIPFTALPPLPPSPPPLPTFPTIGGGARYLPQ